MPIEGALCGGVGAVTRLSGAIWCPWCPPGASPFRLGAPWGPKQPLLGTGAAVVILEGK